MFHLCTPAEVLCAAVVHFGEIIGLLVYRSGHCCFGGTRTRLRLSVSPRGPRVLEWRDVIGQLREEAQY